MVYKYKDGVLSTQKELQRIRRTLVILTLALIEDAHARNTMSYEMAENFAAKIHELDEE